MPVDLIMLPPLAAAVATTVARLTLAQRQRGVTATGGQTIGTRPLERLDRLSATANRRNHAHALKSSAWDAVRTRPGNRSDGGTSGYGTHDDRALGDRKLGDGTRGDRSAGDRASMERPPLARPCANVGRRPLGLEEVPGGG